MPQTYLGYMPAIKATNNFVDITAPLSKLKEVERYFGGADNFFFEEIGDKYIVQDQSSVCMYTAFDSEEAARRWSQRPTAKEQWDVP